MATKRNFSVLSVGLNVGTTEPAGQAAKTLAQIAGAPDYGFEVLAIAFGVSEWEGVPERFAQVLIAPLDNVGPNELNPDARSFAAALALNLDQAAVAVLPYAHDLGRSTYAYNWRLVDSEGHNVGEGSLSDYPVLDAIRGAIRGTR